MYGGASQTMSGSSPLMRGKRGWQHPARGHVGLIPAHAGKTRVAAPSAWPRRAHPRSCGENVPEVPHALEDEGSSPLMRGKRSILFEDVETPGLIPAHAGKTRPMPSGTRAPRAHPRSCGENALARTWAASVGGSSPLMRGKPGFRSAFRSRPGLIPAHAGKTTSSSSAFSLTRAHPRSRGENTASFFGSADTLGSSPLMRGKPAHSVFDAPTVGLIPTHAGKTGLRTNAERLQGAHPRSCGENRPVE